MATSGRRPCTSPFPTVTQPALRCCWRLERGPSWTPCDASWLPSERKGAPRRASARRALALVTPRSALQARPRAAAAVPRRGRQLLLPSGQQHALPHGAAILPERPHHDEAAAQRWIPSLQVRLRLSFSISAPRPMAFQRNRAILHHRCFQCCHGDDVGTDSRWTDLRNRVYQVYSQPDVVTVGPYDLHRTVVTAVTTARVSVLRLRVGVVADTPGRRRGEDAPRLRELRQHLSKAQADPADGARVGGDF